MKLITPPQAEDLAAVRDWFDALSRTRRKRAGHRRP